jgi:hypothetical protein
MNSYAQRAASSRQNRGGRPIEGDYQVCFKDWQYSLAKTSSQPMFTLLFKVIQAPTAEESEKFQGSNRRLKLRVMLNESSTNYGFDTFLSYLEDFGVDLSAVRPLAQDPEFLDFKGIMGAIENAAPKMVATLKHQSNSDQYYNLYLKDLPKLFQKAENTTPAPAAASLPTQPPVQPVTPQTAPIQQAPQTPPVNPTLVAAPTILTTPAESPVLVSTTPVTPTTPAQPVVETPAAAPTNEAPAQPQPDTSNPVKPNWML